MYFSRISLNPLADPQQLARSFSQDTYNEHQALWRIFDTDPDKKRDFLYRQVIEHGKVKYYVLSERIPMDESGIWLIDPPKPYDPKLSAGQKLFFTLRANPIVTVTTPEGKKQRHDVVMHEKTRIGFKKMQANKKPPLQTLIHDSCIRWLQARAEPNGFAFNSELVNVDGYQQHASGSKKQKSAVRYSSVDFSGVVEVTDPALFKKVLFHGIGKSKAFGCGLMLIKRI